MLRTCLIAAKALRLSVRLIQNALRPGRISVSLRNQNRTLRSDQILDHFLKLYHVHTVILQYSSRNSCVLPKQADQNMLASHITLP